MKIGGLRFVAEKSATTFQTSLAEFYLRLCCTSVLSSRIFRGSETAVPALLWSSCHCDGWAAIPLFYSLIEPICSTSYPPPLSPYLRSFLVNRAFLTNPRNSRESSGLTYYGRKCSLKGQCHEMDIFC